MRLLFVLCIIAFLLCPMFLSAQQEANNLQEDPKTTLTFGGYAKLDFLVSDFLAGNPAEESFIRDIYAPAFIPVGDDLEGFDTQIHAKQSRFFFEVRHRVLGSPVRMHVEMDFLLSRAGDARVSNSYNPRLRLFYFDWKGLRAGQDWSTFMTTSGIPQSIIFPGGGTEGYVFIRQALLRYTYRNWAIAIENPESTIIPYQQESFVTSSGGLPDLVAKHTFNGEWGEIGVAGIYRTLRYVDPEGGRHFQTGFGFNLGGFLNAGKRNMFQFMVTYGQGLGRYLALQFNTGGVTDENNNIRAIDTYNGMIAYTRTWHPKIRTLITGAFFGAEDFTELTGGIANEYAWSGSLDIQYLPHPSISFGIAGMYGYRELENGVSGAMTRLQFSATYHFNWSWSIPDKES